jgi:FkbM family methyltransferase
VLRPGSVHVIRVGPLRGLRFRTNAVTGLAPLYSGAERRNQAVMQRLVRPGQIVVDVGANWGLHTLLLSRLVGRGGRVIAIEPFPAALTELRWHVAANGLTNVSIVPVAIGTTLGTQPFTVMPSASMGGLSASHSHRDSQPQIEVEVRSLDGLLADLGAAEVAFVKIDAEGGEGNVLRSAGATLRQRRPYVLVESMDPDNDVVIGSVLTDHGYRLWRIDGPRRWPRDHPLHEGNGLPPIWNQRRGWPDPFGVWGSVLGVPIA